MQISAAAGRTGSPTQWYLPGTDTSRLPPPPVGGDTPPVPGALEETVELTDGSGGTLLGGLVSYAGASDAGPGFVMDVQAPWNGVKNGSVLADEAGRLTLSGFVHADVTLGDGGDSFVLLRGAKRGNVLTGDGADTVAVEGATNALGWVNEFRMVTGAGDDTVVVRALDAAAAAEADTTFASTTAGTGAITGTDETTLVFAELGAGTDTFVALDRSIDRVSGGAGADAIRAGGGDDVLDGGEGDDLFLFVAGDGQDTVLDFQPGADRLSLDWDGDAEAILAAATEADGATTLSYGADSVTLVGVLKAQLSVGDLL
jgi:hypothetical protein